MRASLANSTTSRLGPHHSQMKKLDKVHYFKAECLLPCLPSSTSLSLTHIFVPSKYRFFLAGINSRCGEPFRTHQPQVGPESSHAVCPFVLSVPLSSRSQGKDRRAFLPRGLDSPARGAHPRPELCQPKTPFTSRHWGSLRGQPSVKRHPAFSHHPPEPASMAALSWRTKPSLQGARQREATAEGPVLPPAALAASSPAHQGGVARNVQGSQLLSARLLAVDATNLRRREWGRHSHQQMAL